MLTRSLFIRILPVLFAITFSFTAFSQYEEILSGKPDSGTWSVAYSIGPNINFENNIGYKYSMEICYQESASNEFLMEFSSVKMPVSQSAHYSILECSVGSRIYPFKSRIFFAEGSLGAQISGKSRSYTGYYFNSFTNSSRRSPSFYLAAGIGAKLFVTKNNSFFMKIKYSASVPYDDGVSYIGAQVGLDFNNSVNTKHGDKQKPKFSVSTGGGFNSPHSINGYSKSGEGILIAEGTFVTGSYNEIFLEASYNRISYDYTPGYIESVSFDAGPRFYINKSMLRCFFEFGGGINYLLNDKETNFDPFQPAISIGTGFTGKLNSLLALFLKGKIHILFTDNPAHPPFSSLAGGVRFNL